MAVRQKRELAWTLVLHCLCVDLLPARTLCSAQGCVCGKPLTLLLCVFCFVSFSGEAERVRVPGEQGGERPVAAVTPDREELLPQQIR